MKVPLVYNPQAGRGRQASFLKEISTLAETWAYKVQPLPTAYPGHGYELARQWRDQTECLWVLGGDGTIRECGAGLIGASTALWILPGGTSNVLARSLGIPLHPIKALQALLCGTHIWIDVGYANGEPFFFMCGAGIDGKIMDKQDAQKKRRLGRASFYPVVFKEWLTYPFPPITLTAHGKKLSAPYIAVTNVPYFAGKYRLCPEADPQDGKLNAVLVRFSHRWQLPFLALSLLGRPKRLPKQWEHLQITEGVLSSTSPLPWQVDGDTRGSLPVHIKVSPKGLKVRIPHA